MEKSSKFGSILVAAVGILLVAGIVLFTAFGVAEEGPAETKGGFSLSRDSARLAYHYAQASNDGRSIQRGIRVHDVASGQTTIRIKGLAEMHLHSPVFSRDGNSLILASACWADNCPDGLHGSRLISVNLSNGTHEVMTGDGLETPFWDFGYVNEQPKSFPAQISRSHPIVTHDGIYYLMATADPRGVSTPKDFAPRRLTPRDEFILQNNGGHVGFRGKGSLTPFGPDNVLILAGPARGGSLEATTREDKVFAYVLDKARGGIEVAWGQDDLDKLGISRPVSTETATGMADETVAYFAAGNDIIIASGAPEVFHSVQDMNVLRIWDLALSGDGKSLLAVVQQPGADLPSLTYVRVDTTTKARTVLNLSFSSGKTIEIQ